jgi:phosphoglycolate phosphatase-like HAD superfamily hydrolase
MKENKQILVLDFDGVICNSIHDSYATSLNTYIQLCANHSLPLKKPLTPNSVFQFEEVHPEIFRAFSELIPLANSAEDYFVLLSIIDKNLAKPIHNQRDFDQYKKIFSPDQLNHFHDAFYQTRSQIRQKNLDQWLNLLPPFPEIPESIHLLSKKMILSIATSKDRTSVELLLNHYGISDNFKSENILDKDFATSKQHHLIHLQKQRHIPFSCIHFVDDKISHLQSVKKLGVHNYLACWGFNSEREYELARKEGFTLLQIEDLKHLGEHI